MSKFGDFVRRINTVHVGSVGLVSALTSGLTIIFAPAVQGYVDAHTNGLARYAVDQGISAALTGARTALAPSIFAAWAGMPKPVKDAQPPTPSAPATAALTLVPPLQKAA